MKNNPFTTTLDIAARARTNRPDLRILYRDLPPTMGAGYHYPDPPNRTYGTILLPKIDTTELDENQKIILSALVTHELGHHDRSQKKAWDEAIANGNFIKDLVNCLEDARIEIDKQRKWISLGAMEDLFHYRMDKLKEMQNKKNEFMLNPWGFLFQVFKYYLPNYGMIPVPADMKEYFNIGMGILNKSDDNGNEGNDESEYDDSDSSDSDSDGDERSSGTDSDETVEGEEDDQDSEGSDSSDDDTGRDDDSESDTPGSPSDKPGDETDDGEGDSGSDKSPVDENESDDSEEGESTRPQSIEDEYGSDQDGDNGMPTDSLGIEVAGLGNDEEVDEDSWEDNTSTEEIDDLIRHTPKGRGNIYIPYTKMDREIFPHPEPELYGQMLEEIGHKASTLRRTLTRILAAKSNQIVERGFRTGRMDPHLYYKIPRGGRRVKSQITPGIQMNTAVTMLMDLSGSMMGIKAKEAARISALFGEAMAPIPNINFEVLGYNSSPLSDSHGLHKEGYTRTEVINYWIFKTFAENWAITRNRLGATMRRFSYNHPEKGGATGGANVDHENVIHAAKRLYDRPETNKVMIVLCDGAPAGCNMTYDGLLDRKLIETVQRVKKAGIKVFCYGIMSPEVEKYYAPDFHLVDSLDDLDTIALRKLGEYLLG